MNDSLQLRPLTARSVVLSTLLGAHPPRLSAHDLVQVGRLFKIAEGTVRVTLSRMAAGGDLEQDGTCYRLAGRQLERQARQNASRSPRTRPWTGNWEVAVATAEGRPAADRAALRQAMSDLRMAQLRAGTWLRPANLVRSRPAVLTGQCMLIDGTPDEDPVRLAATLWDLPGWAAGAEEILAAFDPAAQPERQFMIGAAALRHLQADPILPGELLPPRWPGTALRETYDHFEAGFERLVLDHLGLAGRATPAAAQ
jgi:phenylacetic acid degradation operon negative regulatory protein